MKSLVPVFTVLWRRLFEASSWAGIAVLANVVAQNVGQHTDASHAAIGVAVVSALIAFLRAEGVSGRWLNDLAMLRTAMPMLVQLVSILRPAVKTTTGCASASPAADPAQPRT